MIPIFASAMVLGLSPTLQEIQLPHHTFADSIAGWSVFGLPNATAKIALTHESANLKIGPGSLQFDYGVAKGESNALLLPTPDGALAKMKSLKFWLRCDYATSVAVILQEKDGGRYMSSFSAPKGKWQRAEIGLTDFSLSTSPNDPKDPNGRLDPDQIEAIAIFDLGQMFVQGEPAMASLFGVVSGPHSLYLSDFAAAPDALSTVSPSSAGETQIDTLSRPQVQWTGIGISALGIGSSSAMEGNALHATYHLGPGQMAGLIRRVAPGSLAGAAQLSFKAISEKPIKLLVQCEETDGGKYNAVIEIPAGSAAGSFTVALSDLKVANDSKDSNDKLDTELISQILFVDLSGMADQVSQDNVLQIGKVTAKKA